MWRHVFKNRWIALTWSALICWQAYDYVKPSGDSASTAASAVVDDATSACLVRAGNDLAEIARCSEVARRAHG
jgi:hypothetical protein